MNRLLSNCTMPLTATKKSNAGSARIRLKYVLNTYILRDGRTSRKPILMTRHAVQRALKYDLSPETVERTVKEGKRQPEGKTKTRYTLRTKNQVWVLICDESADQIIIITITKGR
jgi:hypothetical protein